MRTFLALTAVLSALYTPFLYAANPQSSPVYLEGIHYHELPEPVPVADPDRIEVTEVFWYGCSHCFHFEPRVLEWEENLPADINFVKLPAMWNRLMESHARAFYAARELGVLEDAHQAIYNALNLDRQLLDDAEAVADLLARYGADWDEVIRVYNSPAATAFLKAADARARAYRISGTPQLIVHGRYRIEASQQLPQNEMFSVVEFLASKIRAEQSASSDQ